MKNELQREREIWERYRTVRFQRNLLLGVVAAFIVGVLAICTVQLFTVDAVAAAEAEQPERVFETLRERSAEPEVQRISLGEFKITHYCPCEKCCGRWADGRTATGTVATAGRTIAVDPSVIPYGTTVYIDGQAYVAEDSGSGIDGKRIDVFCDSHIEALHKGVYTAEVEI